MLGSQKKDADLGDLEINIAEIQTHNRDNVLNPNFDGPPRQEHESTLHHISAGPPQQGSMLYHSFDGQPRTENTSYLTCGERDASSSRIKFVYKRKSKKPPSQKSMLNSHKKLEDEMQKLVLKIQHHRENIRYLKDRDKRLDQEIMDCQIENESSMKETGRKKSQNMEDLRRVIIGKYENTAAVVFCRMKYKTDDMSDHSFMKDIVGVVATLGTCDDPRLSSILPEYLGLETMLGVVCKTFEGFKALEAYNKDGSINKSFGIHAYAADMGILLEDRFEVYCLANLRTYTGKFIADDPQRRLDLAKPILQGKTPTGFLGFAVNMVSIDSSNMYTMSKSGHTLRETLFYTLFSTLQVYRSREDMLNAQPVISNDAVSLDGGVIRKRATFSMGPQKGDVDIRFSIRPSDTNQSGDSYENRTKETKCKKSQNMEDLQREQALLDRAELKKQEHINILANSSPYATQMGGVSKPC